MKNKNIIIYNTDNWKNCIPLGMRLKNKNITIYNTDNWKNCIPLGMRRSVGKETIKFICIPLGMRRSVVE